MSNNLATILDSEIDRVIENLRIAEIDTALRTTWRYSSQGSTDGATMTTGQLGAGLWHTLSMKTLRHLELKSGHSDNGPAWIAYVTQSKSGRTLYFNSEGLMNWCAPGNSDATREIALPPFVSRA
jgi:hypothetical protein